MPTLCLACYVSVTREYFDDLKDAVQQGLAVPRGSATMTVMSCLLKMLLAEDLEVSAYRSSNREPKRLLLMVIGMLLSPQHTLKLWLIVLHISTGGNAGDFKVGVESFA